jgi:hypothetical protein
MNERATQLTRKYTPPCSTDSNFDILLKNFPKAIGLENFQYFRHFSKFPKTFKNSLNISVMLIILENLGKF